jgi:RNA polymerase sigma-70 factor, ECF subfamily
LSFNTELCKRWHAVKRNAHGPSKASLEDEHSFTLFAVDIGPQALRLALRWTRNLQVAEDVVQESLIRTWQSRTRIKESPRAWFLKILWNVFLNHQKRNLSNREIAFEEHASAWNTDGDYKRVDNQDEIARLLTTLPEIDRHLLAMGYGEDFTVKEISHITGMPIGTVKSRIHRALKEIRKSLPLDEANGTPTTTGVPTEKQI